MSFAHQSPLYKSKGMSAFTLTTVKNDLIPIMMKLDQNMAGMKLTLAMMAIAELMVETARVMAPIRTGYLRSTIEAKIREKFQIDFGASAHYAGFVEYGTSKMRGWPFIRPAIEAYQPFLMKNIIDTIFDGM